MKHKKTIFFPNNCVSNIGLFLFSSKGFDGRGNYNCGITEQIIFPEINYDQVNSIRGMNMTIVTTAHNDYEAYELLVALGFPINEFSKKNSNSISDEPVKLETKDESIDVDKSNNEDEVSEDEVSEDEVSEDSVPNEEGNK